MRKFMDGNFLLSCDTAKTLFHGAAKEMPIYDYHCHISPAEIAADKRFKNITEVWLYGDHYKWRAMRSNGIDERYITGDADDYEKFVAWARTVECAYGNPLYHWTHLELQRYFGIYEPLTRKNADAVWEAANKRLSEPDMSVCGIINRSNVYLIGTTDDPADSLEHHRAIRDRGRVSARVVPAFRPDRAVNIEKPGFAAYVERLAGAAGMRIGSLDDLLSALSARMDFFHSHGCRLSDHAVEYVPFVSLYGIEKQAGRIFSKAMGGCRISPEEAETYRTFMLRFCASEYHKRGWAMQLHIGAMRDNNTLMYRKLGPDSGYDSVHDHRIAYKLSRFLDSLSVEGRLPKTVLYVLNPRDNYVIGTMLGNFQDGSVPGKIQFGSAWWFCDNRDGMEEQMKTLANLGLLSRFVGMLTDSRSFLSYTRHEYFRRILCNLLGTWAENGEIPADMDALSKMVRDICFDNAKAYFGM